METNTSESAGAWLSIKDAAAVLGCDERTVRRRRDRGELEGRKRSEGNRKHAEVWVEVKPDKATGHADLMASAITTASERVERPAAAAIQAYQERAALAEATVGEVRADLRRARTGARIGWSTAATVGVLAAVGGVLGVRAMTTAAKDAEALSGRLSASEAIAEDLEERLAQSDDRAEAATQDARRLSGQVSTLSDQVAALSVELSEAREAQAQAERERMDQELVQYAPGLLKP